MRTLYLFDGFDECRVFTRNADGKLHIGGGDDLPESFAEDYYEPGFYYFAGEIFQTLDWTPEQCDAADIPHSAAGYSEWWQGTMKPASASDILAVLAWPGTDQKVGT